MLTHELGSPPNGNASADTVVDGLADSWAHSS